MELNTTGIDKFLVYIHAKDHFVPYESGTRTARNLEKGNKCVNAQITIQILLTGLVVCNFGPYQS